MDIAGLLYPAPRLPAGWSPWCWASVGYWLSRHRPSGRPLLHLKNAMVITQLPRRLAAAGGRRGSATRWRTPSSSCPRSKKVTSISSAGLSQISLELYSQYKAEQIPQIWDELRRKINDLQPNLPPGSARRRCGMIFSDVFGYFLLLTGGATAPRNCAISPTTCAVSWCCCRGGQVSLAGVRREQVQVEISRSKMSSLGIARSVWLQVLSQQNVVSNAGRILAGSESIRLALYGRNARTYANERLVISDPGSPQPWITLGVSPRSAKASANPGQPLPHEQPASLTLGVSPQRSAWWTWARRSMHVWPSWTTSAPAGMQLQVFYDQAAEVPEASVLGIS